MTDRTMLQTVSKSLLSCLVGLNYYKLKELLKMLDSEYREVSDEADRGDKNVQYIVAMHLLKKKDWYNQLQAKKYLEKAANQKHPRACFEYAKLLMAKDELACAAEHFFTAARHGVRAAKLQFQKQGELYQKSIKALQEQYSSCRDKDKLAMTFTYAYQSSKIGLENDKMALWFLENAVSQNSRNTEAVNLLADSYYVPLLGQQQDLEKAYSLLNELVGSWYSFSNGDAHTYFRLGEMREYGKGTNKSIDDAIKSYKKAAESGNADAAYRLGVIYYTQYTEFEKTNSNQAQRTKNDAIRYFETCDKNADAFNYLGLLCDATEEKTKKAHYYRLAADMDLPIAARNLAVIYSSGNYGDAKKRSAINWYTKAAKLGNAESQHILSLKLLEGEDVEANIYLAFEWCLKAVAKKDKDAIISLKTNCTFVHLNKLYILVGKDHRELKLYNQLEKRLGYEFQDPIHLLNALNRFKGNSTTAEAPFQRYEFVGDSILNAACAATLTINKPEDWLVHDLHLAKEKLVRNDTVLPCIAKILELSDLIVLDETEYAHQITDKMLADATEALIGAICFDKDIFAASQIAKMLWLTDIRAILKTKPSKTQPESRRIQAVTHSLPNQSTAKHEGILSNGALHFFNHLPSYNSHQLKKEIEQHPDYVNMHNINKNGYTPLMYKIEQLGKKKLKPNQIKDRASCVALLLRYGATLNDEDYSGQTARELLNKLDNNKISAITKLVS